MHRQILIATLLIISFATVTLGQEWPASPGPARADAQQPPPAAGNASPLAESPVTLASEPAPYGAPPVPPLPPPPADSNTDLARRVADLEKQLADYKKATTVTAPPALAPPKKPLIFPSGRIQMDVANFTQDANSFNQFGDLPNAVGFRRARIALLGEYQTIDYIIEMEFANRGIDTTINSKSQGTGFKDVYVQMRDLPWLGNVRVGHFKECFGLEQLTSDNYTTFMERSVDDEGSFVPGRNNGIMMFNWSESQRATWAIGTFTNQTGYDQPPLFQYDHWGLDLTMRATCLPWYDEPSGGRGLLHTGIDYAYRSAPDHIGVFASRPETAFFFPTKTNYSGIVNMKLTDVDHWQVLGTEAALVYGPLSFQSEFFAASVDRINGATNNFYGAYAYVSYFLTGENRPYNRKLGVFDRVRPYEDFFRVRTGDNCVATGWGAWEVAYRFSYIDMLEGIPAAAKDPLTAGAGRAADHTFGLNWYLNPYTKIMFNYIHSLDAGNVPIVSASSKTVGSFRVSGANIDEFMMRIAMDF
jgi:phosphate-selective porin OprO and OprP